MWLVLDLPVSCKNLLRCQSVGQNFIAIKSFLGMPTWRMWTWFALQESLCIECLTTAVFLLFSLDAWTADPTTPLGNEGGGVGGDEAQLVFLTVAGNWARSECKMGASNFSDLRPQGSYAIMSSSFSFYLLTKRSFSVLSWLFHITSK